MALGVATEASWIGTSDAEGLAGLKEFGSRPLIRKPAATNAASLTHWSRPISAAPWSAPGAHDDVRRSPECLIHEGLVAPSVVAEASALLFDVGREAEPVDDEVRYAHDRAQFFRKTGKGFG